MKGARIALRVTSALTLWDWAEAGECGTGYYR